MTSSRSFDSRESLPALNRSFLAAQLSVERSRPVIPESSVIVHPSVSRATHAAIARNCSLEDLLREPRNTCTLPTQLHRFRSCALVYLRFQPVPVRQKNRRPIRDCRLRYIHGIQGDVLHQVRLVRIYENSSGRYSLVCQRLTA